MRKGKGYGLLVKDWLWGGLFLGLAVCNVPFGYEVNVLDCAAFSGTFTVERHLRGNTAYQTYLTGALATQRYVTPGRATLRSK